MLNKFILIILNYILNNDFFVNTRLKKYKKDFNNLDFTTVNFDNLSISKNIFLSKKNWPYKEYNEASLEYHNFSWLLVAKKIGGGEAISLSKKNIFEWKKNNYRFSSFAWNGEIVAKRLINLIYNFDFFAISADYKEKNIIFNIIAKNYFVLNLKNKFEKNIVDQSIQIQKALLLYKLFFNINIEKILSNIKRHLVKNVNSNGVHISMNSNYQSEYINDLYEIKNMLLFFNKKIPNEIEFQILNMTSSLMRFFHKDNTIAYFNGANNAHFKKIKKITELSKDIKAKDLHSISNGIAIYEKNNLKIFYDVAKPSIKLIEKNLHSGTLSFELSCNKEKIITNCGSIEKRGIKKLDYLRFSAAHSTIILNNTNISELAEKKSYKRVPENILFDIKDNNDYLIWHGNHDGYRKNFNKIVSRKLFISKKGIDILGEDSIISTKMNEKDILYDIRFHLTPICKVSLTRGKNSVLIKTQLNNSYIFEADSNLAVGESVYINNGKSIEKTNQIVISGFVKSFKKTIKWKIRKL